MQIGNLVCALEQFAPLCLQDGFDNAGWQLGLTADAEASGVLLCLDVTEPVITEAIALGCNLIVSHHPLLFHPLKRITADDYIGRCLLKATRAGIALYAAHTNLDNAPGGVNARMAEQLDLRDTAPLLPKQGYPGAGSGLIGLLPHPMPATDFIQWVKERFRVACVRHNNWQGTCVNRLALCGGAGAFLIPNAIEAGADAFLTGEIGYHRFFGQEERMLLLEIGHYESEQFTVDILAKLLRNAAPALPIHIAQTPCNPIRYH